MRKLLYVIGLLVVAAGSFAFLPKAENEKEMMMIFTVSGLTAKTTTISPDGATDFKAIELDKKFQPFPWAQAHQAELTKLNVLRKQGWHVARHYTNAFTYNLSGATTIEVVYALEKK